MASLGELFITLGVKADEAKLKRFDEGVKSLRNGAIALTAAFTGAVVGLNRFVDGTLQGVVALQNLSNQTGLAIEELERWQQAGQLSNLALNAEQIAQSIGNVQQNLAQIRLGQGNLSPFQLLGVDVIGQDAFSVLEQLRGSIQGLDAATATNLLGQIGLTPDFINLLKLSREEFESLSENTFLNKKQREDIDRVGTSIKALQLRFIALKDQAVAKIAPDLNNLNQEFFQWLKNNGDKVIDTITEFAKGFALFTKAVGNAFSVITSLVSSITGIESGAKALAVAFGAITLAFRPMLLGFTALLLVLDDIAVFQRGGESLFGDFISAFTGGDAISGINAFAVGLGGVALALKGIGGSLVSIKSLGGVGAVLGAGAFLAKSPELGKKLASFLEEKTGIDNFIDNLLGTSEAAVAARIGVNTGGTTINNNIEINGLQQPEAVRDELTRGLDTITTQSLRRVQVDQGNNLR